MARSARKPTGFLSRFRRAREGATAVEFAIVATPFLALMFGILDLGLVFLVSTTLENAVEEASRKIRTGELQSSGGTASTFKTSVCDEMSWLGTDCSSALHVDVRTFATFAGVTTTDPTTNGAFDDTKTQFSAGDSESIVLVRVYYEWGLMAPLMNPGLKNLANGKRLISATATFRNEPYAS
ncbi:MAG: pilus assembly protein [Caulobacterales bacterium]|nr:pilus assembly protein [Caulobacterales bacterium]